MIKTGSFVKHTIDETNFGLPMEVLDVRSRMVYCKHCIHKSKGIYIVDWFSVNDVVETETTGAHSIPLTELDD